MSYYHLPTATERSPRSGERRTDTGEWVTPPNREWADDDLAACGFVAVVPAVRPDDTGTHTADRSVQVTDGTPVEVWTVRPWTADELAARTALVARSDLIAQVEQATTLTKLRTAVLAAIDAGAL